MTVDPELDVWQEQWHTENAIPVGLRSKVERQTRMIRIALTVDALVTIVMGGWTTTWAVMSRRGSVALLAAATWIFIASAWIFVIVNLRGAWAPHELSVAEFLAVSIRRCRARLRAAIFGAVLCVVEIVFCLEWLYWNYGVQDRVTTGAICGATAAFVGLCVWYYQRQKKELATLMATDDKPASFKTRRKGHGEEHEGCTTQFSDGRCPLTQTSMSISERSSTDRAAINGNNNRFSTGPRVAEGKQVSRFNAMRHTLCSQTVVSSESTLGEETRPQHQARRG